jgi:hypothetical protein
MAAVTTSKRQFVKQLGDPGVEHGTIIPAGLVAESAGEPRLSEAGFATKDDVVVGVDPIAGDETLEQRPVEIAGNPVVDILDGGLVAELGVSQPCGQALVVAIAALAIEQQAEASAMGSVAASPEAMSSAKAFAMPNRPSWLSWSRVG